MNAALIKLIQDIRSSYWFIPTVMVLTAIFLSGVTGAIDETIGHDWMQHVPWVSAARSDDIRAVLSTIAGSMITVAGVTFSMTIVSVSNASSQFGPRLVGNFMRDRGNQVTLGTFIATFVYCLLILGMVEGPTGLTGSAARANALPRLSFTVALALAFGSIAVLIYFINHVPETLNIGNITARVGADLCAALNRLFPSRIGEGGRPDDGNDNGHDDGDTALVALRPPDSGGAAIVAAAVGYIQALDETSLIEVARQAGIVVHLEVRPGDFVTPEMLLLTAVPGARVDQACHDALLGCFAFGRERTPTQDALFLANELVEIMARALSPGVCDPFTAINCIDWLENGLGLCIGLAAPDAARRDGDGALRVVARPVTFAVVARTVFDKSLQYVAADRNAALHMMRMIAEVAVRTADADLRARLGGHAAELAAAGDRSLPHETQRQELRRRHAQVRTVLAQAPKDYGRRDADGWLAWPAG